MAPQASSNALKNSQSSQTNHSEEMKQLKAKHKREFEALRLLWDKDREELRSMAAEVKELRKEMDHLADENKVLRLNQAINGSSNDHEACEGNPLFMKGVETRLRHWELNKMVLYDTCYDDLNQDIVERGNIAAHHQDVKADMALFKYGYLSEETETATFKKIYRLGPQEIIDLQNQEGDVWFEDFCALIDSAATLDRNLTTDSQTRKSTEYTRCQNLSAGLQRALGLGVKIDSEEITKLQKLTAHLVTMERKKIRRR